MSALVEQREKKLPGGVVITDTGQRVNILDRKEDNYWDTALIGILAALLGNQQENYFRQVALKGLAMTVFTTDNQIVGNEQILVTKLGLFPKRYWGSTNVPPVDTQQLWECAYAEFRKNDNIKKRGPLRYWQDGYGLTGSVVTAGSDLITNGVASPAAIPSLLKPFELNDEDLVECFIRISEPGAAWVSTIGVTTAYAGIQPATTVVNPIQLTMHGFIVRSGLRD